MLFNLQWLLLKRRYFSGILSAPLIKAFLGRKSRKNEFIGVHMIYFGEMHIFV